MNSQPMSWSVRRELWENRSIYLAPLIVTAVVLFASLIATINLPERVRSLPTRDPAKHSIFMPYSMAPAPVMLSTFIVGIFYCLDALYGERRDRSILFWKSLPVSDRTTVLSKVSIPFVVLPLIAFVLSAATQLAMMLASSAILLGHGLSPAPLWAEIRYPQSPMIMLYGLAVHTLWFAPIYAWMLLISAWARRTPVLWALLPFPAAVAVERIAFNTKHVCTLLQYRVTGAMSEAFSGAGRKGNVRRLSELDPLNFLSTPGLWLGLIFAAVCIAAAIRIRHQRAPI